MKYKSIAIEREFSSGGTEIGEKLAGILGIPCYGRQILEMAAERSGLTISEAEKVEESITGSLMYSLFAFSQISSGNTNTLTNAQILGIAESQVIKQLALGGAAVYIGRSAVAFLENYGPVLKVFIRAELDKRLHRAEHVYGYSSGEAEKVIRKYDKRRSTYYKAYMGSDWRSMENYHIILDSGTLGIESAAEIIYQSTKGQV